MLPFKPVLYLATRLEWAGMHRRAPVIALACSVALLQLLNACSDGGDALQRIQSRGELQVVTRNSPTTYYLDREGENGFEYALVSLLAKDLGVELRISTAFTLEALFESLARGEADVAAAGLTFTADRAREFPHSTGYKKIRPQVVYVVGSARPDSVADLVGRNIVVLADGGNAGELRRLRDEGFADLEWQEVAGADAMELLDMLEAGQAELAIVNSNEFEPQSGLFPQLNVAFDLLPDRELDLVWYLAPTADNTRLQAYIDQFFLRLRDDGTLERLREQYFRQSEGLSREHSQAFNLNIRTTLPQFRELIEQVAREYQMEWQLLAAIAYQESHWDPLATSPTGVRGLMMLTERTAQEVGVSDRLDPLQSLRGGSRYLKDLKRRLPRSIREPDRTWFALAAYNMGLGHLEDARVLTQRQGGDPNSWDDVMMRLPLLQKQSSFKDTRYGYAPGGQAFHFVKNIRHYQDILNWQDISENKPLPPLKMEDYLPAILRGSELQAL